MGIGWLDELALPADRLFGAQVICILGKDVCSFRNWSPFEFSRTDRNRRLHIGSGYRLELGQAGSSLLTHHFSVMLFFSFCSVYALSFSGFTPIRTGSRSHKTACVRPFCRCTNRSEFRTLARSEQGTQPTNLYYSTTSATNTGNWAPAVADTEARVRSTQHITTA